MSALAKGTIFPAQLETKIFNLVKGHSSLAKLSGQEGLPFNGKDVFTFNYSSDIAVVGENATKPAGDATITPVSMQPVKVVYQMRVSDEFMYASEEYKLNILAAFAEGFASKLGAGLDKMAIHGINPATGQGVTALQAKSFDTLVTNKVEYDGANVDKNIDAAVALVESAEFDVNGAVISPITRGAIAILETDNGRKYPEFAFGATPATIGAMKLDTNATVSANSSVDRAIVGDFSAFKWGIAKQLPLEVIQYGDPDNTGVDLKGSNQVCLRSEAYIGWAIMAPAAFARVTDEE